MAIASRQGRALTYQFFRPVPARYGLGACQHSVPVHVAANASAPAPWISTTADRKVPGRSPGTVSTR